MKNTCRFIDLFCGIGGFRYALENACTRKGVKSKCVFSCDIDKECQQEYFTNFGEYPFGDITKVQESEIPNHDILLAGFPCQPFSIIGDMKGFQDTRGTLFFEIARILRKKKPIAFVLENVKLLVGHDSGRTFSVILETLSELGYYVHYKVLNALNYGLPQKRERVFIVGFKNDYQFDWPKGRGKYKPLSEILEKNVEKKYFASEKILERSRQFPFSRYKEPLIWHHNKSGHVSAYPFSCALRAGASYNYLLVNGERRLTPREMLRIQGFPEDFKIVCNDSQIRKQAGNSLPIPVAEDVIYSALSVLTERNNKTGMRHSLLLRG